MSTDHESKAQNSESPRFILESSNAQKRAAWAYLGFCILVTGAFLFVLVAAFTVSDPKARAILIQNIPLAALNVPLHFFVFFRVVLPIASSRFYVYEDRVEVLRGGKTEVAPFSEIVKLYGRVFPSIGGNFGFALKSGKVFNFAARLPGLDRLIDVVGAFSPANKAGLAELRTNVILHQHGYTRIGDYFRGRRAIFTATHLFLLPLAFSAYLVWRQEQNFPIVNSASFFAQTTYGIFLAVGALATFFAFALNRIIDGPTIERLAKNPGDTNRDTERERLVFRDALPVYLFALFSLLGLFNRFDLNTLSRTQASVQIPHLGLQAGQILWIDERTKCVGCRHSLREGDVVVFQRQGSATIGKVVGMPGKLATLTAPAEPGRAPASESVTLAPGKIAVRSNPNGDLVQAVDLADVRGRAEEKLETFLRDHD